MEELHRRKIALQGCFVFGFDNDTPDVFLKTAEFAVRCGIDLPRFAIVRAVSRYDVIQRTGRGRPHPDTQLGTLRWSARRFSAAAG